MVEGSEDFLELAAELREADRKLANRIRRSLREIAKPLGEAGRDGLADEMPMRGGLSDIIAAAKVSVSTVSSSRSPRVEARVRSAGHDLEAMNRGELRHPVFGTKAWVSQSVPAGGASRAFDEGIEPVREAVQREVAKLLSEIRV